jgi:hypothetical protein
MQTQAEAIIAELRALRAETPPVDPDSDEWEGDGADPVDVNARELCRYILREAKVYDAHGCPLCLG